jgi:1-acyl-sn-glycerol-3-phosphate acyltransferase
MEREKDDASKTAVVIPLHEDAERRRSAGRRSARRPQPVDGSAAVYAFAGAAEPVEASDLAAPLPETGWEATAWDGLGFLRRRLTGNYSLDDYGFDRELSDAVVLPVLRRLYHQWFRVEVNGIEHIPASGGALLVANHSGGIVPLDVAMTSVAVHDEHPAARYLRMLGDDRVFGTPALSVLARRMGVTRACAADAERLLNAGELVGAWPEGFDGIGKPFSERYALQRFRRNGFVSSAVAAGVPIIPVSIVGAEEIYPVLGKVRSLARLLDVPYFPLTPTFPWFGPLGLVPLPSKWYIEFGAPISTDQIAASDDPAAVSELTDLVREQIQMTLYRLLGQRRGIWR